MLLLFHVTYVYVDVTIFVDFCAEVLSIVIMSLLFI